MKLIENHGGISKVTIFLILNCPSLLVKVKGNKLFNFVTLVKYNI